MEMNLFEIGINIFEVSTAYIFLLLYFRGKFEKKINTTALTGYAAIIIAVLTYFNSIYIWGGIAESIFMVGTYFLYSLLLLKGNINTKLFISGFISCVIYCSAAVIPIMMNYLFKFSFEQIYMHPMSFERIVTACAVQIAHVIIFVILLKNKCVVNKPSVAVLIVLPIAAIVSAIEITDVFVQNENLSGKLLFALIGTLIESVLAYYVFVKMSRDAERDEALANARLSEEMLNMQVGQYKAMVQSQNELKKVRHDLKNHLIAIDAKLDKGAYADCSDYVRTLLKEVSGYAASFNTGNTVLDAILSAKEADAKQRGIKFTARLNIPSDLPIEDNDICAIFGNALDNAIEACEKVKNNPYINVLLSYAKGTLTCKIENSCTGDTDNSAITTKVDVKNHGIGKMNIQRALDKYFTVSDVKVKNGTYTLSIVFMDI